MATKDEVFRALRHKPVRFDVGGLSLWLRPMSVAQKGALAAWQADHKGDPDFAVALTARMVTASVCDESGVLVFGPDDGPAVVADLDPFAVESIAAKVLELNGIAEGKASSPTARS